MKKSTSLHIVAALVPTLLLGVGSAAAAGETAGAIALASSAQDSSAQRYAKDDMKRNDKRHNKDFIDKLPRQGVYAEDYIGTNVTNRSNDEDIGTVSDLVIDGNGKVTAVIVGVGGFLGMGDKDVAIGWDRIQRRQDGDDFTLEVDMSEDDLRNAPEYDRDLRVE